MLMAGIYIWSDTLVAKLPEKYRKKYICGMIPTVLDRVTAPMRKSKITLSYIGEKCIVKRFNSTFLHVSTYLNQDSNVPQVNQRH